MKPVHARVVTVCLGSLAVGLGLLSIALAAGGVPRLLPVIRVGVAGVGPVIAGVGSVIACAGLTVPFHGTSVPV